MSAPILYFKGAPSAPENEFGAIATNDFKMRLDKSPALIRESFEYLVGAKQYPEQWTELDQIFNTCTNI